MKTSPVITFLATLIVFLVGPFSLELSGSLLFIVGFGGVLTADYGNSLRQLNRYAPARRRGEMPGRAPIPRFKLAV
ncbi:MAG: hypothetical protein ABIV50_03420 [Opitutus sp.]